jgi:uncharacterized protein YbjT (DUF2867 family)
MQNAKTILVTGATGNQGGAVARNLLRAGFRVKVLTRNPAGARAQALKKLPLEVIQGDLNQGATFRDQLEGVDGIFSVQTFQDGVKKEIKQGITLANLAKEYYVGHFLYSSVSGADVATGVPHWESKLEIEKHIRQSGLPFTIIRPTSFYENFLIPQVRDWLLKGKLVSPVRKDKAQQFISTTDVGKISARIFTDPAGYLGKTVTLAAEQLNLEQVAAIFSDGLGREMQYQKMPSLITRLAMGNNLYKMFRWVNGNETVFVTDIEAFRKEYPDLMGLRQWIKLYF